MDNETRRRIEKSADRMRAEIERENERFEIVESSEAPEAQHRRRLEWLANCVLFVVYALAALLIGSTAWVYVTELLSGRVPDL
jgi:hypothetical protein